ncbi:MAG: preprotein translocase subunit SecG [Bacteroidaceae bacterium]|nr:preprotein translocase subunit SecG [Bacteroidaceae bacterium]MCF0193954.1 preprotein translocase subunit SecG [Bacteroidaceae bacterium]
MYSVIVTLIAIASVLMCIVVLLQESKGGGLASSFSGYNQIMGVRKTTDFIEKVTWGLAIIMVVLSIISTAFVPTAQTEKSVIDNIEVPATSADNIPSIPAAQEPAN